MKRLSDILFLVLIVLIFTIGCPLTVGLFREVFKNEVQAGAEKGNVDEQLRLAQMYQIGKFYVQSDTEAKQWYLKAKENGSKAAHDILCNDFNICEVKNGYKRNN